MGWFDSPLSIPLCMSVFFFSALVLTALVQNSEDPSNSQHHRLKGHSKNKTPTQGLSFFGFEPNNLDIVFSNKYVDRDGPLGKQYPWAEGMIIAEPYLPTTFSVKEHDPNYEYRWELYDEDDDYISLSGPTVKLQFRHTHKYWLMVKEYDRGFADMKHAAPRRQAMQPLTVKYVRREVRNLMDDDVQTIFDAMAVMWEVDDEAGQDIYGDQYLSMQTLLKINLQLTATTGCDHLQSGPGFFSHSSALSYVFEQSLQAVNPRASLPYWDYKEDIEQWLEDGGSDFTNGVLFQEKYFGSTDPETGYINNGRWKDLQIPKISSLSKEDQDSTPHNIYGYLRSPWSNNDDAHLIRSSITCGVKPINTIDRCDAYNKISSQETPEEFAYFAHNPQHTVQLLLGGTFDCEETYDTLKGIVDQVLLDNLKIYSSKVQKILFEQSKIECTSEMPYCYCPEFDTFMSQEDKTEELLSYLAIDELGGNFYENFDFETKRAIVNAVCNSHVVLGDQLQASSVYAPEFWMMHPTTERLFIWKQTTSNPLPTDQQLWSSSGNGVQSCTGHSTNDKVLSGVVRLHNFGDRLSAHIPTLEEMMKALDPNVSDRLPYIYDNFDYGTCSNDEDSIIE
mmetsp:Transcript_982/g.1235  ORF Transcript_982/g.1235 Transcript_982/m.1235 type:complete len:620 (+) Transcript_982:50-1909(+)